VTRSVVSPKRAAELLFTGDFISADTALAWGIVNRYLSLARDRINLFGSLSLFFLFSRSYSTHRVVPREKLDEAAEALARASSRGSWESKAAGKRTFYETLHLPAGTDKSL
jgi:enoyl-CoA hydratase/carnithine racemase